MVRRNLRAGKPGTATDVFLGYEQAVFQFRDNPEKFAAKNTLSNNIVSLGAETYYYTVGGTNFIVPGAGNGAGTSQTAAFVYHDPAATNTAATNNSVTQRLPFAPTNNQAADIYIKIGYAGFINTCFLYYTTDGTNPEGVFGTGKALSVGKTPSWRLVSRVRSAGRFFSDFAITPSPRASGPWHEAQYTW